VCQKEYSVGVSATPLVVDGIVYYPTWGGLLVALDYKKCKVLWQTNISEISLAYKPVPTQLLPVLHTVSRTTPMLIDNVLILGTQANALLLAIDKRDGKLVDQIQLNDHPIALITMSPTVWQDRIFVGIASTEESASGLIPGYVCCSFVENMNGLVFQNDHFSLLWTQTMVPRESNFSEAAIWGSQPAIDSTRDRVLIGTGNVYSVPDSYTACQKKTANTTATNPQNTTDPCAPPGLYQESVIALDTATGHIAWFRQFNPIDAWNLACLPSFAAVNPGACPPKPGPDADFGMAPTFIPASPHTPHGEDTIVIGQKNGNLYGLAAHDGNLFWVTATSPGGLEGGLIWGLAADNSAIYYTAVNILRIPWQLKDGTKLSNSAFGAASLITGKILWETPVPRNELSLVLPSVVNDVVLVGVSEPFVGLFQETGPGTLLSLNKHTGAIIEETTLDTYWQGGIAIVQGYVMFGTGYIRTPNGTFNVWMVGK
jgi:outer membrane protein assembly factor BamB